MQKFRSNPGHGNNNGLDIGIVAALMLIKFISLTQWCLNNMVDILHTQF